MSQPRNPATTSQHGFTLVELAMLLVFAVVTLLSLHSSLLATLTTRKRTQASESVQTQGYDLLQRLSVIPFGTESDPPATGPQLAELFDDDLDLGTITLRQVMTPVGHAGHTFTTERQGVRTRWRVAVHTDLDGDGRATGFRENRSDLLAIEVYADDHPVFRSLRAADFLNTKRD